MRRRQIEARQDPEVLQIRQQLSLWDEDPAYHGTPDISSSFNRDIIIMPSRWADGETSPDQLERLALLSLGELVGALYEERSRQILLNYHLYPEALKASRRQGYRLLLYRIISTSVLLDQVLCACEYLCSFEEFFGAGVSQFDEDELE